MKKKISGVENVTTQTFLLASLEARCLSSQKLSRRLQYQMDEGLAGTETWRNALCQVVVQKAARERKNILYTVLVLGTVGENGQLGSMVLTTLGKNWSGHQNSMILVGFKPLIQSAFHNMNHQTTLVGPTVRVYGYVCISIICLWQVIFFSVVV